MRIPGSPVRRAGATLGLSALGLSALVLFGASLVLLGACGGGTGDSAKLGGVVRTPPLRVGTVALPDASAGGAPFTMRGPANGLLLVYFGYTNCPDICPTTLADIGQAIRRLPAADRKRVDVAFVTVDPERDTGEVMTSFLDHFVQTGHALRTDDRALQASSESAFGVQAKKVVKDGEVSFDHTGFTYAVEDRGAVLVEWPFGLGADAMHKDLVTMLNRIREQGEAT
ncbi:MAG: SCO family protein [Acidimicrobiia bacterium]